MWAIVEIGKKQYKVKEGDILKVERIKNASKEMVVDKVLFSCENEKIEVGMPYLKNWQVKTEICGEGKEKKIIVYKYKRRKKYRKKQGHRQIYTLLKICNIVRIPNSEEKEEKDVLLSAN